MTKFSRSLQFLFAALVVGLLALPASAQRRGPDPEITMGGSAFKSAFKSVVVNANKSTVRILCQDKESGADAKVAALGTIVGADGYVLTKASELKGDVIVELRDGTEKPAKIVGVAEDDDLAMLKIDARGLTPIQWADSTKATVGQWVATTGMNETPVAVGVVSVGRRKIPGRAGMLGVMLADADGGAKVMQVVPESPAEAAGVHADDIIVAVNKKPVDSRDALIGTIRNFMPGQEVLLEIKRGEKKLEIKAKLVGGVGTAARAEMMNQMGGPLSVRNANFPAVLQHDTVLLPVQCGGPLITLDGKALGINIARAGRVESYVIPADLIVGLIPDLKSGKMAPKSQEKPTTKPAEKKNED